MSLLRDLTYLEHIKESIGKIQSYTQNLSEETFQESTLIQDTPRYLFKEMLFQVTVT